MRVRLRCGFALMLLAILSSCGQVSTTVLAHTDAPSITSQPADQRVSAGQVATFTVTAAGSAPLSYQWSKNGARISAATATSYTTPAATAANDGDTYAVMISNSVGSVASAGARLMVSSPAAGPPTITSQPQDTSVVAGAAAPFSVVATGSAPLTYQWRKNGNAIAGATAAGYTTTTTSTADNNAMFSVVVSNAAGSVTSRSARLGVSAAPPVITSQPADANIHAGQTATFSVVASGSAPLAYQWRKNGAAIAGATAAAYTTPAAPTSDTGAMFSVVVSNSAGSVTSRSARLGVSAAPPVITSQPADASIRAGQTATFSVLASGSAPLAYQWRKNGAAIAGATAAAYTTAAAATSDTGAMFSVVVSNVAGSATSRNALLTVGAIATAGTDVTTYKNDLARSGQNLSETTLTLSNVSSSTFGRLRFLASDGKVDAQPLYLSALTIGGAAHNVVFVASENDTVYAYDADSGAVLWQKKVLPAGETVSDLPSYFCDQVLPTIGVTATPVIDRHAGAHGIIYLVAMSKENGSGRFHQRLHALDVSTGAEVLSGPVDISATYPSSGGTATFDPGQYVERAALLLSQGTIYTSFTSHCDAAPYSGWIIAYNAGTLARTAVLNVAPNSGGGGPAIWMSGGGPAADAAGNVYLATANGAFEAALDANGFPNQQDYGNSVVKLSLSGSTLRVADYFTMLNVQAESDADLDLGSGGVMLLPDQADAAGGTKHLAVVAGKDGNIYVLDRDGLGKFSASANNIWQQLSGANGSGIWATPAYFNGTLYYGPQNGTLRAFTLSHAKFVTAPSSVSSVSFTYPGTSPVVSANGTSNAIVWAHMNTNPAVLYAFEAGNLAHKLYDSSQAANGRDQFGAGNKFITPTVVDGKVFVGTQSGVAVFGLLP
ncbi:MAG TPA: hypothetical protein VEY89_11845 [Candidatus Dormibacteraeota bacterium]|nr:hypothetical protein [Candidatus Dormibacteraeota bacterium]